MQKVILLKFGELSLKGKNKKFFVNQLKSNLTHALKEFNTTIKFYFDFVLITDFKANQLLKIKEVVLTIPGFSFLSEALMINKDLDTLKDILLKILPSSNFSFKVITKRSDKNFNLNSDQINRLLGHFVLNHFLNAKVDVHNPKIKIFLELKQDFFLLYFKKESFNNGLPIESGGKVLMLLSGGIDSSVASNFLMQRGFHVDFITFLTPPHTSDQVLEKIKMLINQITKNNLLQNNTKLYICNFSPILHELNHISKENYKITLLRRSFFRIAKLLAERYHYQAIATGEALGQVASQTIESMNCINHAINNFLVLRPLTCFDKETIIDRAKKIGTYDISILPYEDSCSIFAPKNPITRPKIDTCLELEKEIDLLNELEQNGLNKLIIYDFKDKN